jgi:hypothetical protein
MRAYFGLRTVLFSIVASPQQRESAKEVKMNYQPLQQTSEAASALKAAYPEPAPRPVYLTVEQFSQRNPAFTPAALRNLIFKADERQSTKGTIPGNGLIEAGAIVRVGRKVLIVESRFFDWVESQQERRAA